MKLELILDVALDTRTSRLFGLDKSYMDNGGRDDNIKIHPKTMNGALLNPKKLGRHVNSKKINSTKLKTSLQ
jgi:hypothetical protein